MTTGYKNLTRICLAAVLAFGLAACGGGSDTKSDAELKMEQLAAAESACGDAGGRWESNNTCTSAAELIAEARAEASEMACTDAGGRYESDGSCTSAAVLETERLAGLEMACTEADGRWNADNTCTSAAELADQVEMERLAGLGGVCNDAGGRWESDNTCTSAADLETERLAGLEMACTEADGRWNADNTCTDADGLETERLMQAEMDCTGANGRWNDDNTCTDADGLETERLAGLEMACTEADGRWNADNTCTDADGLETERLMQAEMDCTGANGRWNDDDTCSTVADLAGEERDDIDTKIVAAQKAVDAINNDSDDAAVATADEALMTLSMAITDAANIDTDEKAAFSSTVEAIRQNLNGKKSSRQMALKKKDEATTATTAATAAKLYVGISAPVGDVTSPAATDRAAGYNTAGTAILVSIGDGTNVPTAVSLSEDEDNEVIDNHGGWKGKKYMRTTPASEGMYEAVVYSNIEAPTEGKKFGGAAANTEFEYGLTGGALGVDTSSTVTYVPLISSSDFGQRSGVKRHPITTPNPNVETAVTIQGSFHGVSGTYKCTPASAICASRVAANGIELGTVPSATDPTFTDGGGSWMFTPTDANARVMSAVDSDYASYGWWIHKAANDGAFTASAFVDEVGTVAAASGLDSLNGKADYVGGAAGKYALASSTGGMNDAGHFTARATLNANFTTNTAADTTTDAISGTIDMFKDADGKDLAWKVSLEGSPIGDTGVIGASAEGTIWTIIGGVPTPNASGNWSGSLRNNGVDGVPQVATGTFFSEYGTQGNGGKMVGAFGVNKQEQQ